MGKKYNSTKEFLQDQGQGFGVQTDKGDWYGKSLEVKSDRLEDAGTGKAVVIRQFDFSVNPTFKGSITRQEIFNMHWRQIRAMLWSDGLVPNEDLEPRVVIAKGTYKIFIVARPRLNTVVIEKPQTLQQILQKKR